MISTFKKFISLESSGGIVLFLAAILALICDNTTLAPLYRSLFNDVHISVSLAGVGLTKPLILWINDGLMTIFFLLVGMEIKREVLMGELNTMTKAILPGIAAIGGMIAPGLIYFMINRNDPLALQGWAIPTATDIAFALGVLSLLGKRIPMTFKVFLLALAIMDDLGAIVIIAIFYTHDLSMLALGLASVCVLLLILFNRLNVVKFSPYAVVGIILWVCVLKSGVHATLAGVVIALCYPARSNKDFDCFPSRELETTLHPWVSYLVLPIFAFANAGVPLMGIDWDVLMHGIPLGIICGLFFGKQIGIFGACWIAVKTKIARLPSEASWLSIYGISLVCGIGFTMSLFIGSLAFGEGSVEHHNLVRGGVLIGSTLSGLLGYILLRFTSKAHYSMKTVPNAEG